MEEHAPGGMANPVGFMLMVVVQCVPVPGTGTVFWTDGWPNVILLFMTGRIHLGADLADWLMGWHRLPSPNTDETLEQSATLPAAACAGVFSRG